MMDRHLAMPELDILLKDKQPVTAEMRYQYYIKYYYKMNLHYEDITQNILLLHNSWTPDLFKKLSYEELKQTHCTLANILNEALLRE